MALSSRYNYKTTDDAHMGLPEKKLWRAVLNQAVEDGLGLYNTFMCDYEKKDAEIFLRTRTFWFDEICEYADVDPNRAWKLIQKFKLIKKGIVNANEKREILALGIFNQIEQQRRYRNAIRKKSNRVESHSHDRRDVK